MMVHLHSTGLLVVWFSCSSSASLHCQSCCVIRSFCSVSLILKHAVWMWLVTNETDFSQVRNKVHIIASERTFLSVVFSALSTVSDRKGYCSFLLSSLMFMNRVLGVGRFCGSGSRKDCEPQKVTHTLTASKQSYYVTYCCRCCDAAGSIHSSPPTRCSRVIVCLLYTAPFKYPKRHSEWALSSLFSQSQDEWGWSHLNMFSIVRAAREFYPGLGWNER